MFLCITLEKKNVLSYKGLNFWIRTCIKLFYIQTRDANYERKIYEAEIINIINRVPFPHQTGPLCGPIPSFFALLFALYFAPFFCALF